MEFSEIRDKAKPYFLEGNCGKLAILIHGFTGTPHDLKELGEFLNSQGISVCAPLLPGHGRVDWKDLEKVTQKDWEIAIEEEVKSHFNMYDEIYLIGYSFGANLAFNVAVKYPDKIKGVISLGISIFLRRDGMIRKILPLFHALYGKYRKRYIKKKHLAEYEETGSYAKIPTKSIYELYKFIDNVTSRDLTKVCLPTLIIHSRNDKVTHYKSSQYVHDKICSKRKELIIIDDINHNPLNSKTKDIIFDRIKKFIISG